MLNKKGLSAYYMSMQKQLKPKGAKLASVKRKSNFWKPKEGVNVIRILPWEIDPLAMPKHIQSHSMVLNEKGKPVIEDGNPLIIVPFSIPFKTHDLNTGMVICGNTYGDNCGMCKRGSELWIRYGDQSANVVTSRREFARSHFSNERYITLITPIDDDSLVEDYITQDNTALYQFGKGVWLGIAGLFATLDRKTGEPKYGDITDRESGRVIEFTRVGTKKEDTEYSDFEALDDELPLPEDFVVPDLFEYLLNLYPIDENLKRIEECIEVSIEREAKILQPDIEEVVNMEHNNGGVSTTHPIQPNTNTSNRDKLAILRQKVAQQVVESSIDNEIEDIQIEIDNDIEETEEIPF